MQRNQERMEQLQQMAQSLEIWESQLEQLEVQKNMMEKGVHDLQITLDAMAELEMLDASSDAIVPVAPAASVNIQVKKPERYIVGIGAGYSVEQPFDKTKVILDNQKEKIEKTLNAINERMKSLVEQIEKVRPVLERAVQQLQQQQQGMQQGPGPAKRINPDEI